MRRTILSIALVALVVLPATVLFGSVRVAAPAGTEVSESAGMVVRSSLGGVFESPALARRNARERQSADVSQDLEADAAEGAYGLQACYPNPFNPTTTITYATAHDTEVELAVFDVSGRRVRVLARHRCEGGSRQQIVWDGRNDAGEWLASGVYLLRLLSETSAETRKLVLLK